MSGSPARVAVLISGRGSNLQALIDAAGDSGYAVVAVISNRADAAGLQRAARAGIPTAVVAHRDYERREDFDTALADTIDGYAPDLVVLAGFMRVLGGTFVDRFAGRIINIHPSLLPDFPGLDTHRRALDAGAAEHGVSVHWVTADLDGGPLIAQARVPVLPGDDPERLAARVLEQEHLLLPRVVGWFARGRLELRGSTSYLDGRPTA